MEKNKIQIKILGNNDLLLFEKLILLFRDVFEMDNRIKAEESWVKKLLTNPGFIAFVITCENELAAGLAGYILPAYYTDYAEIYIYDIAIKPEFQRKGFGRQLLSVLKKYCRENGIKEFFVQAHEEDKHAVDFYQSTGGKAEKVVHFNFEA